MLVGVFVHLMKYFLKNVNIVEDSSFGFIYMSRHRLGESAGQVFSARLYPWGGPGGRLA